ncbi:DUF6597 domain-containing transcriptional factor [Brachybacterium sp. AOP42-E1-35]|uniref:DUF6597 domain-containing transcriptional factor n=1 Tax=Brachybacterium sp. AOP42-E1-35 TaxID=3457664 RepID=UPI00402AD92C
MLGHVLNPAEFLLHTHYDHAQPAAPLRRWVDRYWSVTWQLPPGQQHVVTTLDDPAIHLTREWGGVRRAGTGGTRAGGTRAGAWITGPITRGRFEVTQSGTGGVIGVRFRLGGTTAFTTAPPASVRDRTVPAAEWFDTDVPPAAHPDTSSTSSTSSTATAATGAAPALDAWLLAQRPQDAPGYADFCSILELLADPSVTGTAELERRSGHGIRNLQRTFRRFVGVGPKRMILRSRVMDAVSAIDRGDHRAIADLAQDLGWYDQSHFVRDFRSITGMTPSAYARNGDT